MTVPTYSNLYNGEKKTSKGYNPKYTCTYTVFTFSQTYIYIQYNYALDNKSATMLSLPDKCTMSKS